MTGIESTAQNQVFGQNAGTRAGLNQSRDLSFTFQHDTIVSPTAFNQFRMQIARRGLHFGYSDLPGGSDIGVNIPGYAYFGREPYSTVDRIERRFEFTDHVSLIGSGLTSFDDLLSHSYQNGAYFVVQPDASNAIWINGATASTVSAKDFSIVS